MIDPKRKSVSVTRRRGDTVAYENDDRISLALFGGELAVGQIFDKR